MFPHKTEMQNVIMIVLRDHDEEGRIDCGNKYPQKLVEKDKTHPRSYRDSSAFDFLRKDPFKVVIQLMRLLQELFSVCYLHVAAVVHHRIHCILSTLSTFEVLHQNMMKPSIE